MPRPVRTFSLFAALLLAGPAFADPKNPTYDEDILPIVKQHCASCHGNDKQRGGLNLATYAATMLGGSSGEVVVKGDSGKSRMFTLTAQTEEPKMPPAGNKIPQPQIDLIKLWVEQGGRENAGSKVVMKPKIDIGLKSVGKGKPEGPPPMPIPGKFDLNKLVQARRPGAVLAMAASPWAPLVAIGGQKQVLLYNTDNNALIGVLPYEHGQINSLKFSRNAKMLLVAGGRGGASGKAVLFNIETGEKVTEVGANETDAILAADLSPDQTMIAVGTPTKMIRIYSTADGTQLNQIKKHTDWVTGIEFSPDGVLLATGDRNGGVFVWEALTAREFHSLRGHTAMITDMSWRDDSNIVSTCSEDGTIRLWEMQNGGQVKNWNAHPGGASSVKFSHDGKLASTGRDKVTKLWDANGGLLKQFEAFPDLGLQVAITHDNAMVIAGDWAGNVKSWNATDAKLLAVLETNPLPAAERLKQATEGVAAATAKAKQTADAYAPVKAAADKANADFAANNKVIADSEATLKTVAAALPPAKAEVDKYNAVALQLQQNEAAKMVSASAFTKAAAEVQDAATKNPANPMLTEAAKKAQELGKTAQAEYDVAKKAASDNAVALKTANDKYTALVKTQTDSTAALNAAKPKVAPLQAAVKATTNAANAAKVPADAAAAELVAANAKLESVKESIDPAYALKKRVDAAQAVMTSVEAKAKAANDAYAGAKAAADQAAAALATGQKAVVDGTAAAKAATDAVPVVKAELDRYTAAVPVLAATDVAKTTAATTAANAAKAAADAAAKTPADANLAAVAKKAADANAVAQAELAAAKKAVADNAVALKATTEKYQSAMKAVTDTNAALAAAQAQVPVLQAAATAKATAANSAKAAADAVVPEVNAAKAKLEATKAGK